MFISIFSFRYQLFYYLNYNLFWGIGISCILLLINLHFKGSNCDSAQKCILFLLGREQKIKQLQKMGEGSVELEAIVKEAVDLVCETNNRKLKCPKLYLFIYGIVCLSRVYLFLLHFGAENIFQFLTCKFSVITSIWISYFVDQSVGKLLRSYLAFVKKKIV